MCDQVVALLSPEYSTSIVWNDEDSDAKPADTDVGDTDRLFTFEVAKTSEQEENAIASPGFQVPIPFVVRIQLLVLIRQRCIFVTFPILQHPQTVRLILQPSFPAFCLGKLPKVF